MHHCFCGGWANQPLIFAPTSRFIGKQLAHVHRSGSHRKMFLASLGSCNWRMLFLESPSIGCLFWDPPFSEVRSITCWFCYSVIIKPATNLTSQASLFLWWLSQSASNFCPCNCNKPIYRKTAGSRAQVWLTPWDVFGLAEILKTAFFNPLL